MSPIPALSLVLAAGVVLGPTWPFGGPAALAGAILAALGCVAAAALGRRLGLFACALVASGAAGLALGSELGWGPPAWKQAQHLLAGRVDSVRQGGDGLARLSLELEAVGSPGSGAGLVRASGPASLLLAPGPPPALRRGDLVLLRVRSLERRSRANFGDSPRGIVPTGRVLAGPLLVRPASAPLALLEEVRRRIRRGVSGGLEPPARGLALALALGDRSELAPADLEAFRRTGTAHLLAVSGLHVSIVVLLAYGLASRLLLLTPWSRRFRAGAAGAIVAVLCCWLYAALTGLAPPVCRAAVMATAALAASALGRPAALARSVALAAAAMLAADPSLASHAGFQLSFAAVLGIAAWAPGARERPESRLRRLGQGLARAAACSLGATLATAPLVAHHFGQVSLVGALLNLAAIPFVTFLVLPATLLLGLASALSPGLGALAGPWLGLPGHALVLALRWVSRLPGTSLQCGRPSLFEAALLTAAALVLLRWRRRGAALAAALLVLGAGSFAARAEAPRLSGRLRVTVLDVGAGDATVVDLPDGRRILVDAGPTGGEGGRVPPVVTALERGRPGGLALLLLTHGHADHVAGAGPVLERLGAVERWMPAGSPGEGLEALERLARARGSRARAAPELCGLHRFGPVRLEVLHPCEPAAAELGENDRSTVVRLTYGEVAVLLAGDVEERAEAILVPNAGERLRAEVLKLPHHGSDTSSTEAFLDAVRPRFAVASCGRSRGRPLPHAGVVERLESRGVRLLDTARQGAVRISTDGNDLRVRSVRAGVVHGERRGLRAAWLEALGM